MDSPHTIDLSRLRVLEAIKDAELGARKRKHDVRQSLLNDRNVVDTQIQKLTVPGLTSDYHKSGEAWKKEVADLNARRNRITLEIQHLSVEDEALAERVNAAGQLVDRCKKFIAGGSVD